MEQGVNEVIVNELSIQFKNLGLIDECINDVRNALVDISKVYKEEQKNIDEAYQRGFEKGKDVKIKGCEGCMYQGATIEHNPCNLCCNAFLNRWTAKDDKIEVGDEVSDKNGYKTIVTYIRGGLFDGLCSDGSTITNLLLDDNHKTGRHFGIDKILEEIKGDNDK